MINKFELIGILNEIAPPALAEAWDNSGIQIATARESYGKILVALEITRAVIEEAKREGVEVIVTHHPLIFGGIKKIDCGEAVGEYITELIGSDISVISSHTNFDKADRGNNVYLAELLGLVSIRPMPTGSGQYEYMGVIGELTEEMTLKEIKDRVARVLDLDRKGLRSVGEPRMKIKRVALCTGAGADLAKTAAGFGAQLFITGDARYHDAQKAAELGIALIDAGHYGTEAIFVDNMAAQLAEKTGGRAEIIKSAVNIDPFDLT